MTPVKTPLGKSLFWRYKRFLSLLCCSNRASWLPACTLGVFVPPSNLMDLTHINISVPWEIQWWKEKTYKCNSISSTHSAKLYRSDFRSIAWPGDHHCLPERTGSLLLTHLASGISPAYPSLCVCQLCFIKLNLWGKLSLNPRLAGWHAVINRPVKSHTLNMIHGLTSDPNLSKHGLRPPGLDWFRVSVTHMHLCGGLSPKWMPAARSWKD